MYEENYQIIVESGAVPESHEIRTAQVLVKHGDVKFIKPADLNRVKTPDIEWLGQKWEIKSPKGSGKFLLHNTLSRATRQSCNIIIDLRRYKRGELSGIKTLLSLVPTYKSIRKIKVVTKKSELLDIKS